MFRPEDLLADEIEPEKAWPDRPKIDGPDPWTVVAALARLKEANPNRRFSPKQWVRFMDPLDNEAMTGQVSSVYENGHWITVIVNRKHVDGHDRRGQPVKGMAEHVPIVLDVRRTKVVIDRSVVS